MSVVVRVIYGIKETDAMRADRRTTVPRQRMVCSWNEGHGSWARERGAPANTKYCPECGKVMVQRTYEVEEYADPLEHYMPQRLRGERYGIDRTFDRWVHQSNPNGRDEENEVVLGVKLHEFSTHETGTFVAGPVPEVRVQQARDYLIGLGIEHPALKLIVVVRPG